MDRILHMTMDNTIHTLTHQHIDDTTTAFFFLSIQSNVNHIFDVSMMTRTLPNEV